MGLYLTQAALLFVAAGMAISGVIGCWRLLVAGAEMAEDGNANGAGFPFWRIVAVFMLSIMGVTIALYAGFSLSE
ncbi:hypothetical protein AA23498_2711 [Acetobacter nitrogenifigens DSM 23921 = NBRC 105050]|uniref:Uncharacterized protein n=1 Tax=Acetobacter nitrogenifigens DSM 23921 = NBRC 105050 TaxID=1120919 RepID=A0A511XF19_9PROT|nr:hypothetical protein [Acetobacter nitrogenifigens]GBQ96708.1 hypothetical protein AA23498_2711 [Acetobacter nitrogenifigens DSM 23921 = NBRC 105050]GEN61495.1 hypothetical protein ANI02nite_33790 [Acetobacter nitrogenifigens DSM 23921 = NBRC 105050]